MECTSLHSALLKFDQSVILNVNGWCIKKILNNEQLIQGQDIFQIQPPCKEPKPDSVLSEWPPHDRCYFYHDYYQGLSTKFFRVGDHIAKFNPNHKEAVLALNRINIMVFFSKKREDIWYFKKMMASLKPKTKFTIFTDINFSSIYTDYINSVGVQEVLANKTTDVNLQRAIKRRDKSRDNAIQAFARKYDLKTENLKTKLIFE